MSMQAEYRRSDERHGWVRAVESLEQLDRAPDFGQQLELASEASPSLAAALRQAAPRSAKG